jgi:hypothetical protein
VKGKVFLVILLVIVLMLTLTASAFAKGGNVTRYRASLQSLNGSDVTGMVVLTKIPGQLKISVWAVGLVPAKQHAQHVHGFLSGAQSQVPGAAQDTNGDGYVSLTEAVAVTGPVLLDVGPYPWSKKAGFVVFTRVYRGSELAKLSLDGNSLTKRVFMIHGGYWSPIYGEEMYEPTLPVAAGRIVLSAK